MEQAAISVCQHHWVLTGPREQVIHAVCKFCSATREYPARLEATERFDDYQELAMECPRPLRTIYGPLDEEQ